MSIIILSCSKKLIIHFKKFKLITLFFFLIINDKKCKHKKKKNYPIIITKLKLRNKKLYIHSQINQFHTLPNN